MASICQVGIVDFQDGQVIKKWGTFINPLDYFDPFNVSIHGITSQMVQVAPLYSDIHTLIQGLVKDSIVVTHMPFDQTALRRVAQKYGLPEISCTWLDSARVVRRQWEQFKQSGYSLQSITRHLDIEYKSHDAVDDARAAGEVVLKAIEQSGQSLEEWLERAYKKTAIDSRFARAGNPDGPFYGETIVFTGALTLPRREAAQMAAMAGCDVGDGVNKKTSLLVVGIQNDDRLAGYDKSSKHRKAEDLINKGQQIRIISENDFLEMVVQ
jgi:DNA polymerase-3 subunit epsilon